MSPLTYELISLDAFNATLKRYPSTVPQKLRDLDTSRYVTIPRTIAVRKNPKATLTKEHVETLVEWKLKHGTFRPKLLQLVQSNDSKTVSQATEDAFAIIMPLSVPSGSGPELNETALKALKVLTALKGIGPATASLLLSVAVPGRIPFFSDELFRWCMWGESGSPNGWKRAIKYNAKEYGQLVKKVDELVTRLGVSAVDAEKVAYVLGNEGVDVGAGEDGTEAAETKQDEEEPKPVKEKPVTKKEEKATQGTKRKAPASKPTAEGTRKSSRIKK